MLFENPVKMVDIIETDVITNIQVLLKNESISFVVQTGGSQIEIFFDGKKDFLILY